MPCVLGAVATVEPLLDELGELALERLVDELLKLGAVRPDELPNLLVDRTVITHEMRVYDAGSWSSASPTSSAIPLRRRRSSWTAIGAIAPVTGGFGSIRGIGTVPLETPQLPLTLCSRPRPPSARRAPQTITVADVQAWIAGLGLRPGSVRVYLSTLRALLDFTGVDPNPARDGRVRLPRQASTVVDPPSGAEVDTIIAAVPPRLRLPLRVLEQTGSLTLDVYSHVLLDE